MSQGIVVYADGGANPNPGPAGFGVHGYIYELPEGGKPKKGSGHPTHVPTTVGYVQKREFHENSKKYHEVEVVNYIDTVAALGSPYTNNIAELRAAIHALCFCADYDLKDVLVFCDSAYVVDGITKYADIWKKNKWIKRDYTEVANKDYWNSLIDARDALKNRGVNVNFKWVKAHDKERGNIGNDKADRYATCGVTMSSMKNEFKVIQDLTPAAGYWKSEVERHPMIDQRRCYFNSMAGSNKPGTYYMGQHGKDDNLLGKRISDGAYAVVKLAKPESVIDEVIANSTRLAKGEDNIMMIRLDELYRRDTYEEVLRYGAAAMPLEKHWRLDQVSLGKEPLVKVFDPAKLAVRAVECVDELLKVLDQFERKDEELTITDITDIFYETEVKKKKDVETVEAKLKAEFVVGYPSIKVDVNHNAGGVKGTADIILTLGIDMPQRNAIKQLESANPKVYVVTWSESPDSFRHATVIEAGADRGIWAGFYSNIRMLIKK